MGKMGRPPKTTAKRKMAGVRLPEDILLQMQHYALNQKPKKSLSDILGSVVLDWWSGLPKEVKEKYEQLAEVEPEQPTS